MKNIIYPLITSLWLATFILFIYWVPKPHVISGWWWFGTLMAAIFLSELESRT